VLPGLGRVAGADSATFGCKPAGNGVIDDK